MPKKKAPNSNEEASKLTRRDMIKMGAAAGAVTILSPTILTSKKSSVFGQTGVAEPILCAPTPVPPSPPTTPFLDNLPIPFPAIPQFLFPAPTENANIAGGEAARAPHQRWAEFTPAITYQLEARAAEHQFHSQLLPSYIWGFNGRYPAPTVLNAYGLPTIVRFKNSLPDPTTSFGTPEITIHLHNGHTASESDGFAGDFFGSGLFKDNHYANIYAGYDAFGGLGDPREAMHTFWFHDHRAAETANNNYLGLNGMYLVYDQTDPGHEFNTPGSLRLPGFYGITDIPLELSEKRFCPAANGRNEAFQVIGAPSPSTDKWTVNGKIQPKLSVRRRKYRFRILNTGPVKTFNLSLIKPDGTQGTMTIVAVDANFLHQPADVSNRTLDIFVAMRFDVIIDFAAFPVGSSVYLKENAPMNVGVPTPDPAPGLPIENVLMRFDVVGNTIIPDTPPIPATLVELPPIPPADASFTWAFQLLGGQPNPFRINGLPFDANRVDHAVLKGSSEEWHLRNDTLAGNWLHPVHIHFEEGRVLERTRRINVGQPNEQTINVPLQPEEDSGNSRRDVYPLPGQESVRIRLAFRDFVGRYLIHCHNMNHEDAFMMVRWDIVDTVADLHRRRREIAEMRRELGAPPLYREEVG
jgi:FtsP/CotA-like multicopper oxidase with cupredoxin domain